MIRLKNKNNWSGLAGGKHWFVRMVDDEIPVPRPVINRRRRGYSLLEVLLALALSVVVFAAIATAIQIHLAGLTKQKVLIERKQIARAVLTMVANDLRAGIQYKAADYSGLENLVKTQQLMTNSMLGAAPATGAAAGNATAGGTSGTGTSGNAGTAGSTGATGGGAAAAGGAGSAGASGAGSNSSTATGDEETEIIDEENVSFRPAMIGSANVIMIDISRLPRLDQYNPMIASAESLVQSPSDVKSIAYFYSDTDGGMAEKIQFENTAPGGLYRREIDRAVAAYMGDIQLLSAPDPFTKLVAAEVAQIQFRYFDGTDWKSSWDSVDEEGFPVAIEINLVIDPARSSTNNTTYSYGGFDRQTMENFRTVVYLPVSEPVVEEETTTE